MIGSIEVPNVSCPRCGETYLRIDVESEVVDGDPSIIVTPVLGSVRCDQCNWPESDEPEPDEEPT